MLHGLPDRFQTGPSRRWPSGGFQPVKSIGYRGFGKARTQYPGIGGLRRRRSSKDLWANPYKNHDHYDRPDSVSAHRLPPLSDLPRLRNIRRRGALTTLDQSIFGRFGSSAIRRVIARVCNTRSNLAFGPVALRPILSDGLPFRASPKVWMRKSFPSR